MKKNKPKSKSFLLKREEYGIRIISPSRENSVFLHFDFLREYESFFNIDRKDKSVIKIIIK